MLSDRHDGVQPLGVCGGASPHTSAPPWTTTFVRAMEIDKLGVCSWFSWRFGRVRTHCWQTSRPPRPPPSLTHPSPLQGPPKTSKPLDSLDRSVSRLALPLPCTGRQKSVRLSLQHPRTSGPQLHPPKTYITDAPSIPFQQHTTTDPHPHHLLTHLPVAIPSLPAYLSTPSHTITCKDQTGQESRTRDKQSRADFPTPLPLNVSHSKLWHAPRSLTPSPSSATRAPPCDTPASRTAATFSLSTSGGCANSTIAQQSKTWTYRLRSLHPSCRCWAQTTSTSGSLPRQPCRKSRPRMATPWKISCPGLVASLIDWHVHVQQGLCAQQDQRPGVFSFSLEWEVGRRKLVRRWELVHATVFAYFIG
ncbi:hypothetical protein B0J11DRAFT_176381 [Dendryphion nanum]|uniref:Uncharacterized protein n=1 Tax=Dendryphion nanum TaxID=256645 RepID=A0A9P9IZD8_9PLEO|nr:hypothetical protein B0J11DRAFT_176381 [Dendryphion nanum]